MFQSSSAADERSQSKSLEERADERSKKFPRVGRTTRNSRAIKRRHLRGRATTTAHATIHVAKDDRSQMARGHRLARCPGRGECGDAEMHRPAKSALPSIRRLLAALRQHVPHFGYVARAA